MKNINYTPPPSNNIGVANFAEIKTLMASVKNANINCRIVAQNNNVWKQNSYRIKFIPNSNACKTLAKKLNSEKKISATHMKIKPKVN